MNGQINYIGIYIRSESFNVDSRAARQCFHKRLKTEQNHTQVSLFLLTIN
jgi:hypothetical protein